MVELTPLFELKIQKPNKRGPKVILIMPLSGGLIKRVVVNEVVLSNFISQPSSPSFAHTVRGHSFSSILDVDLLG